MVLELLLKEEPEDYHANEQMIRLKIKQKKYDEARKRLAKFKTLADSKNDATYWQAFLDDEEGKEDMALVGYKSLLLEWPDWSSLHSDIAHAHIDNNQPKEGLEWINKAIDLDRGDSWLLSGRARVHIILGDYKAALADTDAALKMRSGNSFAHARRGIALEKLGDLVAAEAAHRKAFELEPRVQWIKDEFVAFLERHGKSAEAAQIRVLKPSP